MRVSSIKVEGALQALEGLSFNKLQPGHKMVAVANKLAHAKEGSHKKFLRQVQAWFIVEAPLYWWTEFDTYKIGVTRQSSSIMHRPLEHADFCEHTPDEVIALYTKMLKKYERNEIDINELKASTPAGVLYKSMVNCNYQTLQTIYKDRHNHKLKEWQKFCYSITHFPYSHWITGEHWLTGKQEGVD